MSDSLQTRIDRGRKAATLLKDPVTEEALTLLGHEIYQEFRDAETDDARRDAWALARALDRFKSALQVLAGDGEFALKEIAAAEKRAQPSIAAPK